MNVIFAAYLGASKFMFVIVLSDWNSEIIHISLPPLSASFISQENELFNAVVFKINAKTSPCPHGKYGSKERQMPVKTITDVN